MVRMLEEGYLEVLISYDSCETCQGDVSSKSVVYHGVCDVRCLMTISEQNHSLVLGFLLAVFMNRTGSRLKRSTFKSKTSSL
jgi:hypothetical protein